MSTFAEWYETHWRKEGETKTRALYRFCVEHEVSHRALGQALRGEPVKQHRAAEALAAATGGAVPASVIAYPKEASSEPEAAA